MTNSALFCGFGLRLAAGERAALAGLRSVRVLQVVRADGGKRHLRGQLRLFDPNPALLRDEVCQLLTCVLFLLLLLLRFGDLIGLHALTFTFIL